MANTFTKLHLTTAGAIANVLTAAQLPEVTDSLPGDVRWVADEELLYIFDGTSWVANFSGNGDVIGPSSSVDGQLPRFDGTSGKLLQTSGAYVSDSSQLSVNTATATKTLEINGGARFYSQGGAGTTTVEIRAGSSQGPDNILQITRADGSINPSDCATFLLSGSQIKMIIPFLQTYSGATFLNDFGTRIGSESSVGWASTTNATSSNPDVAFKRQSAGVLELNSATLGDFRDLFLRTIFVTKIVAPADGELAASQVALWFDDTNGLSKLMIKGKSANGTVVTGSVALI